MNDRNLRDVLRALGLIATADGWDDVVALAAKRRWGPVQLLEHVARLEEADRTQRGVQRRLKRSRVERFKPMADYDWNWPKEIDRPLVESVLVASPRLTEARCRTPRVGGHSEVRKSGCASLGFFAHFAAEVRN